MIVAFKTYFYGDYGYTACGVFDTWADDKVRYFVTSKMKCSEPFDDEEPWKQKIPCIMQCLNMLGMSISSEKDKKKPIGINTIVIDDYVWLEEGKQGLGASLASVIKNKYDLDINIVGVTKKPCNGKVNDCFEISRGNDEKSMYITCINPCFAEHYSFLVANMEGRDGVPTLLRSIDRKAKEILSQSDKSDDDIQLDCADLDKWAEENLSPRELNKYMMSKSRN